MSKFLNTTRVWVYTFIIASLLYLIAEKLVEKNLLVRLTPKDR